MFCNAHGKRQQEVPIQHTRSNFESLRGRDGPIGVIMHCSAKPPRQCVEAAKRANRILGMIERTIVSREQDVILRLYKSLVRPHLEYCVQAWSPYMRQDIDTLEQIQRRANKIIRGLGKLTYEERLMRCGLTNLER